MVLTYVPTISLYNHVEPEKFQNELDFFRSIPDQFPNVYYLEYLEGWEENHAFFFDPIHLNPEGQKAFTQSFSKDFIKLLNGVSEI